MTPAILCRNLPIPVDTQIDENQIIFPLGNGKEVGTSFDNNGGQLFVRIPNGKYRNIYIDVVDLVSLHEGDSYSHKYTDDPLETHVESWLHDVCINISWSGPDYFMTGSYSEILPAMYVIIPKSWLRFACRLMGLPTKVCHPQNIQIEPLNGYWTYRERKLSLEQPVVQVQYTDDVSNPVGPYVEVSYRGITIIQVVRDKAEAALSILGLIELLREKLSSSGTGTLVEHYWGVCIDDRYYPSQQLAQLIEGLRLKSQADLLWDKAWKFYEVDSHDAWYDPDSRDHFYLEEDDESTIDIPEGMTSKPDGTWFLFMDTHPDLMTLGSGLVRYRVAIGKYHI